MENSLIYAYLLTENCSKKRKNKTRTNQNVMHHVAKFVEQPSRSFDEQHHRSQFKLITIPDFQIPVRIVSTLRSIEDNACHF